MNYGGSSDIPFIQWSFTSLRSRLFISVWGVSACRKIRRQSIYVSIWIVIKIINYRVLRHGIYISGGSCEICSTQQQDSNWCDSVRSIIVASVTQYNWRAFISKFQTWNDLWLDKKRSSQEQQVKKINGWDQRKMAADSENNDYIFIFNRVSCKPLINGHQNVNVVSNGSMTAPFPSNYRATKCNSPFLCSWMIRAINPSSHHAIAPSYFTF